MLSSKTTTHKALLCASLLVFSGMAFFGIEAPDGTKDSSTGEDESGQSRDISTANAVPFTSPMINTTPTFDAVAKAATATADETEADLGSELDLSDIDLVTVMAEAQAYFDYVDNCSNCEFQQEEEAPIEQHQQALLEAAAETMRFFQAGQKIAASNPGNALSQPLQAHPNLNDLYSFNLSERITQNEN